ncbi:hypothetical protein AB4Z50_26600 [Paenibacillus sp. 2TAB26]
MASIASVVVPMEKRNPFRRAVLVDFRRPAGASRAAEAEKVLRNHPTH